MPTNNHNNIKRIARGAASAALYALLTIVAMPLSSGLAQLRFSEALCILPCFMPEASVGLFIGCVVANLLSGAMWFDVVFGSLATLLAALITRQFYKRNYSKWLLPLPAVIINALVVGAILCYGYDVGVEYPLCICYVGVGQLVSCYCLGLPLMAALKPIEHRLFD